ncbi:MAG: DUF222 domain-containing protein [Actinomycetales bacterium]|nr:DUF222 domain-containing protein [Actinomycetales bacterium]
MPGTVRALDGAIDPRDLGDLADAVTSFSDADLLRHLERCAEQRRRIDARASVLAAEIARRSRREVGHDGLAQRAGLRTGAHLVQRVTGSTLRASHTLVDAGTLLVGERVVAGESERAARGLPDAEPWLSPVTSALREGRLSTEAAVAIRDGLGRPSDTVAADALSAAAARLVELARDVALERLGAAARAERDDLDHAGIAAREAARHARRYLTLTPEPDGMTRLHGLLDPESAAVVRDVFDAVTSPRRGGPRFVDSAEAARAARIESDPRSTGQLALDAFVALLRVAADADEGRILGRARPAVRVHVAASALLAGRGAGRIEGETAAVSLSTVQRIACEQGTIPIVLDAQRRPLDVGRAQRLFTARQRIALAARDGGCRYPGCDRPPSWCEAHHIDEWARDRGATDLADGVLLCRFHHLHVHNGGFRVRRRDPGGGRRGVEAQYWLEPPPDAADPPRPMPPQQRLGGRDPDDLTAEQEPGPEPGPEPERERG